MAYSDDYSETGRSTQPEIRLTKEAAISAFLSRARALAALDESRAASVRKALESLRVNDEQMRAVLIQAELNNDYSAAGATKYEQSVLRSYEDM